MLIVLIPVAMDIGFTQVWVQVEPELLMGYLCYVLELQMEMISL